MNEQLLLFQGRAMRTLAVAYAETTAERCEDALRDPQMLFVAVAAIADPVREDVPAAVARCMKAGIDIKIVTGDTPATAREIARRIGLWHDETDSSRNEMTGVEFAAMSDEEPARAGAGSEDYVPGATARQAAARASFAAQGRNRGCNG